MSLQTGQILDGKYRIIRVLGSGAMGEVYEGENVRIVRRVAIKVLRTAVANSTDAVRRFEREAQAAGRIGSEHIVEVLDLGNTPDGGFYMVMEFLEGITLGKRIRSRGRLAPREVTPIIQQLLFGLEMAHEAKVIHRDLKPDNVFLVREHAGQADFVKILDFGVSKFNPLNVDDALSMTRTGAVVGTPYYMAPEQAKGARDIDDRSDIYSVGVILFEAITGQVPFHAGTFNELIFKIVLDTPPPPETFVPNLDPAFGRIVKRAMARDAVDRFQTAAEFRNALSVWLHTGRDGGAPLLPPPDPGDEGAIIALDPPDGQTIVDGSSQNGTLVLRDGDDDVGGATLRRQDETVSIADDLALGPMPVPPYPSDTSLPGGDGNSAPWSDAWFGDRAPPKKPVFPMLTAIVAGLVVVAGGTALGVLAFGPQGSEDASVQTAHGENEAAPASTTLPAAAPSPVAAASGAPTSKDDGDSAPPDKLAAAHPAAPSPQSAPASQPRRAAPRPPPPREPSRYPPAVAVPPPAPQQQSGDPSGGGGRRIKTEL
jgi:serine/threonine-protein kinase